MHQYAVRVTYHSTHFLCYMSSDTNSFSEYVMEIFLS